MSIGVSGSICTFGGGLVFDRFALEPLSLLDLADLVSAPCYVLEGFCKVTEFLRTEGGTAFLRRHNLDMECRGCKGESPRLLRAVFGRRLGFGRAREEPLKLGKA
jgi:hypothetical protein